MAGNAASHVADDTLGVVEGTAVVEAVAELVVVAVGVGIAAGFADAVVADTAAVEIVVMGERGSIQARHLHDMDDRPRSVPNQKAHQTLRQMDQH
jgi:hypothetical protein